MSGEDKEFIKNKFENEEKDSQTVVEAAVAVLVAVLSPIFWFKETTRHSANPTQLPHILLLSEASVSI